MTLLELVDEAAAALDAGGVHFGHGTTTAFDEAAWLVLWKLGLPLDTSLGGQPVMAIQVTQARALVAERIRSRVPAAYLTGEAWLQGAPFHADARAIVPRSLIAELLVAGALDDWLSAPPARVLDMCTGGGSLAILAARHWPTARVDGSDVSADALAVATLNVQRHGLEQRVRLLSGDGCRSLPGAYDLVLCNPPYVNAQSMRELPPEYRAEPELALAGGDDGMDFVRTLLRDLPAHLAPGAVLVLEIGHERAHFEAAFPRLEAVWLSTSAGEDQVCAVSAAALATLPSPCARPGGRPLPTP